VSPWPGFILPTRVRTGKLPKSLLIKKRKRYRQSHRSNYLAYRRRYRSKRARAVKTSRRLIITFHSRALHLITFPSETLAVPILKFTSPIQSFFRCDMLLQLLNYNNKFGSATQIGTRKIAADIWSHEETNSKRITRKGNALGSRSERKT